MSFCTQCGKKISVEAGFCKHCSTKVKPRTYPNISKKFLVISILILIFLIYLFIPKSQNLKNQISQLETEKSNLLNSIEKLNNNIDILDSKIKNNEAEISLKNSQISNLNYEIEQKKEQIQTLLSKVNSLEEELGLTKTQLQETTQKYEEAKPYQERINRGQYLSQYYTLLSDNQEYAKPIILKYLGLSSPVSPSTDAELWQRGKQVYNWLSDNYNYCGDKGLRIGTTFNQFQFFSPDELLMSDNARCGDCDDFATLFAGLMYASGVPEDKVWVVCGEVPSGGHCWNWLVLNNEAYRIDGVCSQKDEIISFLGLKWTIQTTKYADTIQNIDCFTNYTNEMRMNPKGFYIIE